MSHHDDHDDFGGLHRDLRATGASMDRRTLLRLGLGATAFQLLGCSSPSSPDDEEELGNPSCSRIPSETEGPFPGDGSNGPNVLNQTGVVRTDIRSSFAGLSGTADGIPLTVILNIVATSSCASLAGRAVYLWQCDRLGRYSLYSNGVTNQNYLRGVQEADGNGRVTFISTFPGCYDGRWPHIHFEVYPTLASATSVGNKVATSQLALPKSTCDAVYATSGYATSVTNLSRVTLENDGIFRDSYAVQLATVTGDVSSGLTATLTVPI